MPGDFGLDPFCLGSKPEQLAWNRQAELQHGRWAMLGVAGSVAQELWTGKDFYNAALTCDIPFGMNLASLLAFQFLMMHHAEVRRFIDIRNPGSVNSDPIFGEEYSLPDGEVGYPGGTFNPFGLEPSMEAKTAELVNGRLAMWAFMGICVSYQATGLGPVACLTKHLNDPQNNTIVNIAGKCVLPDSVDAYGVTIATPCLWPN